MVMELTKAVLLARVSARKLAVRLEIWMEQEKRASEYVRWQLTMQKSSPTDGSGVGIDVGGFVYSTTTVDTPTLVSASVVSTLIAWLSKRDALFSDASSLSMLLKSPFETADVRSDVKDAASADVDPLKL